MDDLLKRIKDAQLCVTITLTLVVALLLFQVMTLTNTEKIWDVMQGLQGVTVVQVEPAKAGGE